MQPRNVDVLLHIGLYMCKIKPLTNVLHSPDHFDMSDILSPVTKNALKKFQSTAKMNPSSATNTEKITRPKTKTNVAKKKRLINCEKFMTRNNIRKESELVQPALQMSGMEKKISKTLF